MITKMCMCVCVYVCSVLPIILLLQDDEFREGDEGHDDWGVAPQLLKPENQLELSEQVKYLAKMYKVYVFLIIIQT